MATNTDRVLDFLRLVAPRRVTNEEICARTGVRPHQQVFQITQRLRSEGIVRSIRSGKEWEFWVENKSAARPTPAPRPQMAVAADERQDATVSLLAREFEAAARIAMSKHYGKELGAGTIDGVPKRFDLVSGDGSIVGDAKFYALVHGKWPPPAKYSVIAEHVWLLEKTAAPTKFLVFGNDRRVPEQWLKRHSSLVEDVSFFFLATDGKLDKLH